MLITRETSKSRGDLTRRLRILGLGCAAVGAMLCLLGYVWGVAGIVVGVFCLFSSLITRPRRDVRQSGEGQGFDRAPLDEIGASILGHGRGGAWWRVSDTLLFVALVAYIVCAKLDLLGVRSSLLLPGLLLGYIVVRCMLLARK